uniref:cathepsin L1-like n=1 Tax=Myxine glutinosa TaxID=7769 RepID=UPI00358F22EC
MKSICFVLLLTLYTVSSDQCAWSKWKFEHGKKYEDNETETFRQLIWEFNLQKIERHNALADRGVHSFYLGMNHYGDLLPEEFRRRITGCYLNDMRTKSHMMFEAKVTGSLPKAVNWTSQGYVTPVRNQFDCGSCWAFSSTEALSGQHFNKTGKLIELSVQQLVDCSRDYGNRGCNGGIMQQAFKYIKENGGIESESSYPYEDDDLKCRFNKSLVAATCKGSKDVQRGNETALKIAVAAVGPISIAIDASPNSFQFYKSGVYDNVNCTQSMNHAVLVVGYGELGGKDYWLVKNSWGTKWGMNGYVLMSRNKDNQCGIASSAIFPLV